MCEAEDLYEELEREAHYYVCCESCYYGVHGFIFKYGSVLDITLGEDHRIISIEDWIRYGILTYTIANCEADARINCNVSYKQLEVFIEMCKMADADRIYIDVYNCADEYKGAIEIEYRIPSIYELYDAIYELM